MQNNIPTLYILELDSSVVKSARISTMLCPFVQKIKKNTQSYCHAWLTAINLRNSSHVCMIIQIVNLHAIIRQFNWILLVFWSSVPGI